MRKLLPPILASAGLAALLTGTYLAWGGAVVLALTGALLLATGLLVNL